MYGHNLDIYIGVKHFKCYSFYNDYKKKLLQIIQIILVGINVHNPVVFGNWSTLRKPICLTYWTHAWPDLTSRWKVSNPGLSVREASVTATITCH